MTEINVEEVNRLAKAFSDSQAEAEVRATYKGGDADTLTAAIAAWPAGQAPYLARIFISRGSSTSAQARCSPLGRQRRRPATTQAGETGVANWGDRLLVVHQGRRTQFATPMEVFDRLADTNVAGFVGARR